MKNRDLARHGGAWGGMFPSGPKQELGLEFTLLVRECLTKNITSKKKWRCIKKSLDHCGNEYVRLEQQYTQMEKEHERLKIKIGIMEWKESKVRSRRDRLSKDLGLCVDAVVVLTNNTLTGYFKTIQPKSKLLFEY